MAVQHATRGFPASQGAPKPFRFGDGPGRTRNVLLSTKLPTQSRLGFWRTDWWVRTGFLHRARSLGKTVPGVAIRDSRQSVLSRREFSNRDSAFLGRSKSLKLWGGDDYANPLYRGDRRIGWRRTRNSAAMILSLFRIVRHSYQPLRPFWSMTKG